MTLDNAGRRVKRFLKKNVERAAYVLMLVSVNLGFLLVNILRTLAPLIPKNHNRDIIFFPYAETDSAGYDIRFKVYFDLLQSDNYQFDIMNYYNDAVISKVFLEGNRLKQYYFIQAILWKRILQILKARKYKTSFVQRSLFPYYPYYKTPYLEMLLKKLSKHVIVDIWDANHVAHPVHTFSTVSNANRVSVVNQYLCNIYQQYNQNIYIWPIAVDRKRYVLKENYKLADPVRLLYTGSPDNVKSNLIPILPLLSSVNETIALELIVIGKYAPTYNGLRISHYLWDEVTYFRLLADADIGLYPVFEPQSEINKGKVAAKTLDYLAAGLPFIGSRDGVPDGIEDNNCYLAADSLSEWELNLYKIIEHQALRQLIATNGRKFVKENLSLESSYSQLKELCFNW